jgi:MinD superfamily P-loop ATPase
MILAVASGKGGTGKTTVSVNLARVFGTEVQLLDCDVEEPNCRLFFPATPGESTVIGIPVPRVNETLCDGCGKCSDSCVYNAIALVGKKPIVFPEMCHGCGGCERVCPQRAISEVTHRIGTVETAQIQHIALAEGRLDVGVAMAPPLIRAVKSRLQKGRSAILDAPPGTSCPVIAAVRGADFILLVTEPTPFGLNDLKLAVDMVREIGIPFGVVINRYGIGDGRVHDYCDTNDIPILLEIPDDRRIAEMYSRGRLVVDALPEYRDLFLSLLERIRKLHASLAGAEAGRQYAG